MGLIDVMLNNYDKNLRKRLAKNRELVKEARRKIEKPLLLIPRPLKKLKG